MFDLTDANTWDAPMVSPTNEAASQATMTTVLQKPANRTRYLANRMLYRIASVQEVRVVANAIPAAGAWADVGSGVAASVTGVQIGDILLVRGYLSILSANSLGGSNAASDIWVRVRITDAVGTVFFSQGVATFNAAAVSSLSKSVPFETKLTAQVAGTFTCSPQMNSVTADLPDPTHDTIVLTPSSPHRLEVLLLRPAPVLLPSGL